MSAARATVSYAKLQAEGDGALHIGSTVLKIAPDARFDHLTVTAGAAVSRSQMFLTTGGERTKVGLNGAGMIGGKQHADATLLIDHALPGANTRVLYKTVVDDEANGVFQGKIIVEPRRAEDRRQDDEPGAARRPRRPSSPPSRSWRSSPTTCSAATARRPGRSTRRSCST